MITSVVGNMVRLVLLVSLALFAWFLWFAATLPDPAPIDARTDAVVVLTGGPGRLARGLEVIEAGSARRMLVSGVDRAVRPGELAAATEREPQLFDCCIDLGREAIDTRGNAEETAAWVTRNRYRSVRLVTSAYHMRRAELELGNRLDGVEILADPVPYELPADRLVREFSKYALRFAATTLGVA